MDSILIHMIIQDCMSDAEILCTQNSWTMRIKKKGAGSPGRERCIGFLSNMFLLKENLKFPEWEYASMVGQPYELKPSFSAKRIY